MKFQRIYRCNHWNVFNKDCSEKCYSRMMLFCSSAPNSWKILCIFASLLFKKLALSEVLSKILNKVLWLLIWMAASNVVKTNRMICNIKTMKLLKLKKKWTDRELKWRYNIFTFGISNRLVVFSWSSPCLLDFPTSFKLQEKII